MQRATVGKVMLLKDGEGRYIWQQNQQAGKPSILLGYEARQAADMDAIGANKLPVGFGNFEMVTPSSTASASRPCAIRSRQNPSRSSTPASGSAAT